MFTAAVFFDLEKAYDKLWRQSILIQLKKWGFGGNIFNYVKSFLTDRSFKVLVNGTSSETQCLENGVPQGSSLSVTLFLIGMEILIKPLKNMKTIKYLVFADDLCIFVSKKNLKMAVQLIQKAINKLFSTGISNGFSFSQQKTKSIVFTNKRKIPIYNLSIGIHNNIEKAQTIKFLGLIWDKSLRWRAHIKDLKTRLKKRLNILSIISKVLWGASRESLEKIVKAIIVPTIDYGSTVYGGASESLLKMLDPILHISVRKMTGAFITSPKIAILAEAGIQSLKQRRKTLDLIHLTRFKAFMHIFQQQIIF